jgi:hypothetical protein
MRPDVRPVHISAHISARELDLHEIHLIDTSAERGRVRQIR